MVVLCLFRVEIVAKHIYLYYEKQEYYNLRSAYAVDINFSNCKRIY